MFNCLKEVREEKMNKNKKYQLKKEDWDNQEACKKEAIRLGYTERVGYLAWTAGQGACGYECVLSFFDDIEEVVIEAKKLDMKSWLEANDFAELKQCVSDFVNELEENQK